MAGMLKVKAKTGLKCPMEGNPRKYITDEKAVEVPRSAYYLRLLGDGSLELVQGEASK